MKGFGPSAPTPSHVMAVLFGIVIGGLSADNFLVTGVGLGLASVLMLWWVVVMPDKD